MKSSSLTGHSVDSTNGCIHLTIGTGYSHSGDTGADLIFYSKDASSNPGVAALSVIGGDGFTRTNDVDGYIASLQTDTVIATVTKTPVSSDPNSFKIELKHRATGNLFRIVTVTQTQPNTVDISFDENLTVSGMDRTTRYKTTTPEETIMIEGITPNDPIGLSRITRLEATLPNGKKTTLVTKELRKLGTTDFETTSEILHTTTTFPWGDRVTGQIVTVNGAPDLITTWDYYEPGEPSGLNGGTHGYGKLQSIIRPNGSEETHLYDLHKHTIFRPFAEHDAKLVETRTYHPQSKTLTVTTAFDSNLANFISKTETQRISSTVIQTRVFTDPNDPAAYLETETERYPVGQDFGGQMKKITRPDASYTSYAYSRSGTTSTSEKTATIITASSDPLNSDGTQTIRKTNSSGEVIESTTTALGTLAGTVLHSQTSTSDAFGRPETTTHTVGTDIYTTSRTYACCGLASETDRSGASQEYAYDALKRKKNIHTRDYLGATPVTTFIKYDGLTTTKTRSIAGNSLFISQVTRSLGGLTTTTWSPDADNVSSLHAGAPDGYPKAERTIRTLAYNSFGTSTTIEHPDSTTTHSESYPDGRTKLTKNQLLETTNYSYGSHNGGLWSQMTAPNGTQWTRSYTDGISRTIQTEYPTSDINTTVSTAATYYSSGATIKASVGKLASSTDLDNITTTITYDAKGNRTTSTPIADNNTRISVTESTLVNDTEIGIARESTSTLNGKLLSTSLSSIDGLVSQTTTLAGTTNTVRTVSVNGAWTVTNTSADDQYTIQTYLDARLFRTESFDKTTASIAWTTYSYDDFDRTIKTTDSRTGDTTVNGYLGNGAAISVTSNGGSDTTSYTYDSMGRRIKTTLPDTTFTEISYTATGQTEATWGSQTYPRFYTYDNLGRMDTLRTKPTLDGSGIPTNAGGSVTTWNYDAQRGWLTEKNYDGETGNGPGNSADYTYTAAGQLATRTWERGATTTYSYDQGSLDSVAYSDTTLGVTYSYDNFGRPATVTQGGNTHTYVYDTATMALKTETINYNGFIRVLDRSQDNLLRPSGFELKKVSTVEHAAGYTYDAAGRLSTVTQGSVGVSPALATYGYEPNTYGLVKTVTGPAHTVTNTYETNRNILLAKTNHLGTPEIPAATISKFDYEILDSQSVATGFGANSIGQRESLATTGKGFDATAPFSNPAATGPNYNWTYNSRGELTQANDTSTANNDRAYQFDAIGNRQKTANGLLVDLPSTANYTANALNQYTAITQGSVGVSPAYDSDGNATAYPLPAIAGGNATLTWDAENRLIEVKNSTGSVIATYQYDYLGRRIQGSVGVSPALSTRYIYDGWNIIAEYTGTTLSKSYTWGMDLSGSMQGAGGVGGLLSVRIGSSDYYPTFDGNGNVSEYLDSSGAVQAHYEYDAFGNTLVSSGTKVNDFAHRFSTKPLDAETGLYYYGYRYYDPVTGRWPSRDPLGERGGMNVYGMIRNDSVSKSDYLGLLYVGTPYGEYLPFLNTYGNTGASNISDAIQWNIGKWAVQTLGHDLTLAAMNHADGTIPGDWALNAHENGLAKKQTESYATESSTNKDFDQWLKDELYNKFYGKPTGLYGWSGAKSDFHYPKPRDGYTAFGDARIKIKGNVDVCKGWIFTTISIPHGVVELEDNFTFAPYSALGNTNKLTPTAVAFRLQDSGYLRPFKTTGTWKTSKSYIFL